MQTIEENINRLRELKSELVTQLNDKGLESNENETFNTLIPKLYGISDESAKISVPFYSLYGYKGDDLVDIAHNITMTANPLNLSYFTNGTIPEGETLDFNNIIPENTKIDGMSCVLYGADIKGTVILPDREYNTANSFHSAFKGSYNYYSNRSKVPTGKIDARNFPTIIDNSITNCFASLCVGELDLSGVDFSNATPSYTMFGDDLSIVGSSKIGYLNLEGATFKQLKDGTEIFTKGNVTGSGGVTMGGTGVQYVEKLNLSNVELKKSYLNLGAMGTTIVKQVYIDGWHVNRDGKYISVGSEAIEELVIKNITRDDPAWRGLYISGWGYTTSGWGFGSVSIPILNRCFRLHLEDLELNSADTVNVTYKYNNSTKFTYKNISLPTPGSLPTPADYTRYKDINLFFENVSICEGVKKLEYLYRNLYDRANYDGVVTLKEAGDGLILTNMGASVTGVTRIAPGEDFPELFLPGKTYHVAELYNAVSSAGITDIDFSCFDFDTTTRIQSILPSTVINCTPFTNLGKGYTQTSNNYSNYTITLSSANALSYDSIIGIINNLYDLNKTYGVADGGTLYTQTITLHADVKALLTADDIAIATNKGWTVS